MINIKDDKDKIRLDLVCPEFIEGVGEVLTYGANKYSANSWQELDNAVDRYYAAAMRHLMAYRKGKQLDEESGISHLKHVAANIMFLLYFEGGKNGRHK